MRPSEKKQPEKVSWDQSLKVHTANTSLDFTLQKREEMESRSRFLFIYFLF